jgi:hypothetical protein
MIQPFNCQRTIALDKKKDVAILNIINSETSTKQMSSDTLLTLFIIVRQVYKHVLKSY